MGQSKRFRHRSPRRRRDTFRNRDSKADRGDLSTTHSLITARIFQRKRGKISFYFAVFSSSGGYQASTPCLDTRRFRPDPFDRR